MLDEPTPARRQRASNQDCVFVAWCAPRLLWTPGWFPSDHRGGGGIEWSRWTTFGGFSNCSDRVGDRAGRLGPRCVPQSAGGGGRAVERGARHTGVAWALRSGGVCRPTWRAQPLARRLPPRASAAGPLIRVCLLTCGTWCPRYVYVAVCSRSGPLTVSRPGLAVLVGLGIIVVVVGSVLLQ